MILKEVRIHNFFRIKESHIELGTGLFHVFGQNKDDLDSISNGSGKSSFCESIFWALFGQTVRSDLNKNDVIGPFDTYCEVEITLLKDEQEIRIVRWRNKPGEKNNEPLIFVDGENLSKHKNTDSFIESVLGFDSKVFLLAGFTKLGSESFCQMSSTNKIKTLKDVLELAKFDKYDAWCRQEIKAAGGSVAGLSEEERYTQTSLERLKQSLDNLEHGRETARVRKENRISELQAKIAKIKSELQSYIDGNYGDKHKILRAQIGDLESQISALSMSMKELKVLKEDLSKNEVLLEKKTRLYNETQSKIKGLDENINNLLDHSSDCVYCGSRIKASSKTSAKIKEFEVSKDDEGIKFVDLGMDKERLDAKVKDLKSRVKEYDAQTDRLIELKSQQLKLTGVSNQIKTLYQMYKVNEESLLDLMVEIQRLQKEDDAHDFDLTRQSILDNISRETVTLELAREKQIALSKRSENLEKIRKIIKILKKDKLEHFIDSLVVSINHYLEKICGSIECEAFIDKDSLVLKYRRGDGDWQPFSVLSSGEQTKVNKSVSFALNELFEVGLRIDDEGLQGLDDEGSKLVLEHLSTTEFDSTVIFVSHQQDVQQFFTDSQSIIAVKEDGIITIRR